MSTPTLDVRGLAYAYPDGHQALFGVDLHVHPEERVALLGPNGAGKTTLVLHLNGILTAGRGSVTVSGLPVAKEHLREIRRRVGIVFQDPDDQLFLGTVRQDVAFGPANLGLKGAALDRRVMDSLDRVGMADFADRPPHHLSYGQRRRVVRLREDRPDDRRDGLARALRDGRQQVAVGDHHRLGLPGGAARVVKASQVAAIADGRDIRPRAGQ